jgi:glycosyltransferase involved in cell wall biosynthesis
MRIGVVTPAYNVALYIGATIRSVLAQTHQDWTMTIVDDGSTDDTGAIAAEFNDPRIRVIRQCNAGVSAARNRGLAETHAEAVSFLDADDCLSPDALALLAAALDADPAAIAAVGPYTRVPGARRIRPPASGDLLRPLLIQNLFANGGHLLIRRSALDRAGTFLTNLHYGEDWEYWIRLATLGSFAATRSRAPLLFVRERHGGAYLDMATRPESFVPCMDSIFRSSVLSAHFGAVTLGRIRGRAEAENDWIIGRELIRHGRRTEGRHFLRRSVRAAPSLRRLLLLAAGSLPITRVGPFRPYPALDVV